MLTKCPYYCFTPDHDTSEANRIFVERFGYRPTESSIEQGLLKLGPVYTARSVDISDIGEGSTILHNGTWYEVGAIERGNKVTILTATSELLVLEADSKIVIRN